jgi:hypothetical protein
MVHRATELVHVRTADDTVTATPNHPFRVAGRGWVAAGELAAGDTLYLADGGHASILSVTREKLASPVDVYNLEVEDFHTYFVASTGVWVHNCGPTAWEKGQAGVEMATDELAAEGYERVATEVSLRACDGTVMRADGIFRRGTDYLVMEAKNGRFARLTGNQASTFGQINQGVGARAFGGNAVAADIDGLMLYNYRVIQYP